LSFLPSVDVDGLGQLLVALRAPVVAEVPLVPPVRRLVYPLDHVPLALVYGLVGPVVVEVEEDQGDYAAGGADDADVGPEVVDGKAKGKRMESGVLADEVTEGEPVPGAPGRPVGLEVRGVLVGVSPELVVPDAVVLGLVDHAVDDYHVRLRVLVGHDVVKLYVVIRGDLLQLDEVEGLYLVCHVVGQVGVGRKLLRHGPGLYDHIGIIADEYLLSHGLEVDAHAQYQQDDQVEYADEDVAEGVREGLPLHLHLAVLPEGDRMALPLGDLHLVPEVPVVLPHQRLGYVLVHGDAGYRGGLVLVGLPEGHEKSERVEEHYDAYHYQAYNL